VAYLCQNLELLRAQLLQGQLSDDQPLEQLLAAVRSGGDVDGPLEHLHLLLQADGDVRGVHGHDDTESDSRGGLPGGPGLHQAIGLSRGPAQGPAEIVHLCPVHQCARTWIPYPTEPLPHCAITGKPLRRDHL
jgi:hypothetical protein